MAYEDYEASTDNGDPVVFFEFTNLRFGTIRYTNATKRLTLDGEDYEPCPIRFSNVKSTKDVQTSELTLTFPRDHEFPAELRTPYAKTKTMVVVRRAHRKDLTESLVYWRGRVINVTSKPVNAEVLCENMQTILKRMGNTPKFQKLCRHGLYSPMCGVSYAAYKTAGEVTAVVNSFTFRIDEAGNKSSGYYKGGIIESQGELGFIVSHVNDTVTTLVPLETVELAGAVTLAPGCSLSISTCRTKFNNILRHGGFPLTPIRSPHEGVNIFSAS